MVDFFFPFFFGHAFSFRLSLTSLGSEHASIKNKGSNLWIRLERAAPRPLHLLAIDQYAFVLDWDGGKKSD